MGRANDKNGEQRIWAGTVMLKPSINAEKAKHDEPTKRPMDRQTDRHSGLYSRVHVTRKNKAGYTATEVACGWAGAIFEVTRPFGQEQ